MSDDPARTDGGTYQLFMLILCLLALGALAAETMLERHRAAGDVAATSRTS